ncbi:PREDICTED: transport protein [Prunus dulcis]|uniref:PREDICTED: transport protein n=1 Tax=Prunus dulcis TaxID=3755 RepID=A0A5E4FSK4_PRUDU|nr:PREDICTED: transport protein [Prunus dulcis]
MAEILIGSDLLIITCPARSRTNLSPPMLCLRLRCSDPEQFAKKILNTEQFTPTAKHCEWNFGANKMLDDWEENLAVITANRTKDDELVIIHLADCLWKDRSEITAAHICYLVAEANFESYSDSTRLCLIGADHWKSPRTYASPEAIQCESGLQVTSYCKTILKSLKTGRAPEVEAQLVLSLEERIKTHQQVKTVGLVLRPRPGKQDDHFGGHFPGTHNSRRPGMLHFPCNQTLASNV